MLDLFPADRAEILRGLINSGAAAIPFELVRQRVIQDEPEALQRKLSAQRERPGFGESGPQFAARLGQVPTMLPGTHESLLTHPDEVANAILAELNLDHDRCRRSCLPRACRPRPRESSITDATLTQASGQHNGDAAVAERMLAQASEPVEAYGDSAYGTGQLRAALEPTKHTAVIKPKPLMAAVEGGFTLDDFTVDDAAGTSAGLSWDFV